MKKATQKKQRWNKDFSLNKQNLTKTYYIYTLHDIRLIYKKFLNKKNKI